jgi:hypothetical protein
MICREPNPPHPDPLNATVRESFIHISIAVTVSSLHDQ